MDFYKKVLVMKSLAPSDKFNAKNPCGILRIEEDSFTRGIYTLNFTVVNLDYQNFGDYFLTFVFKDKKPIFYPMQKHKSSLILTLETPLNFIGGFSVGLIVINSDIPTTLLYSQTNSEGFSPSEFKSAIANHCYKNRTAVIDQPKKSPEKELFEQTEEPINFDGALPNHPPIYDDEAVATIDYFSLDKEIELKLQQVRNRENESIRLENEFIDTQSQKEQEEITEDARFNQDETSDDSCKDHSERKPYYLSVKDELDRLFESFSCDIGLSGFFPKSTWAKIPYSSDKFYVVGKILERSEIKYICYGVPAVYSINPPEELKGYCTFIPLSVFDMQGQGFWMMFQDAYTGKCRKIFHD